MKRFVETNDWRDPWFRRLSPPAKHLKRYLWDNCDCAGVIAVDLEAITFHVGEPIKQQHLAELTDWFDTLDSGAIWIKGFVRFQCGRLSEDCRPHMAIVAKLKEHGITIEEVEQARCFQHTITKAKRLRIIARDGLVCLYTGQIIPSILDAEIDHLIPQSKGGSNGYDNLFVTLKDLNQLRGDTDLETFCLKINIPYSEVLERVSQRTIKSIHTLKDKEQEKEKDKEKEQERPPSTPHEAFIDGWVNNFKTTHGFAYVFGGALDGKAVRELLRQSILSIDLLEIAKKAWQRAKTDARAWNCKQAATIHGFHHYFNQIQVELKHEANSRNPAGSHRAATGAEHRQTGIPQRPDEDLGELLARRDSGRAPAPAPPANGVAAPPPAPERGHAGSPGHE